MYNTDMINDLRPARGRFAPSPTGAIHLGNVWTALLAWLDARQRGGAFVLRMEDLDPDRSRAHLAAQLLDDLRWLGLDWDEGPDIGGPYEPYEQDRRRALYAQALDRLAAQGLIYACYCTRAEVRAAASAPHGVGQREHCPNDCWALGPVARQAREVAGRRPCLRVRMPDNVATVQFVDLCQGPIGEDLAQAAGDFVIRRADGVHAYQLAVVVDDGLMEITHVIRGADLLDSTARQIWLHRALGYTPPQFGHVPLLVDPDGHRLSKRQASLAVAALRAAGKRPAQIVGWLAAWAGLISAPAEVLPRELIGTLDLARLSRPQIVVDARALL
ncbi:MAG TPA: tRNA glutamyl-Q(34) synthetase GluQRS [Herpetosiphonaceae bacterium]